MVAGQEIYEDLMSALGRIIRSERMRLGYSQNQLADMAGFHRTYIGLVENGQHNMTIESCIRFAEALGMTVYDLFSAAKERR